MRRFWRSNAVEILRTRLGQREADRMMSDAATAMQVVPDGCKCDKYGLAPHRNTRHKTHNVVR